MALSSNLKCIRNVGCSTQRCFSSVAACARNKARMCSPLLGKEYSDEKKGPVQCKVAIVTGGARGIGYHISESLLKAGAQAVILGDILVDQLEEATCKLNEKYGEHKALFQPCDVTKKDEMEKIFKCTKDRFGQLDIVVNNAGIAESDWEKIININVTGLVHGTLLGFQHMGCHCGGSGGYIINVASILGLQPLFSMPVYTGTKWFVNGFTKSMGNDYFYNISKVKVMSVCPGVTDTEIITNAGKATLPGFDELDKEAAKSLASLPPQGPSLMEMLSDGRNSCIWASDKGDFYKIILPDRSTYESPIGYGERQEIISIKTGGKSKDRISEKCKKDPCTKKDECKKKDPCKKEKCQNYEEKPKC